jgi:hypothetical protein
MFFYVQLRYSVRVYELSYGAAVMSVCLPMWSLCKKKKIVRWVAILSVIYLFAFYIWTDAGFNIILQDVRAWSILIFFCVRLGESEEELMWWCGALQDVTSSSVWIDGVMWLGRRPCRPPAAFRSRWIEILARRIQTAGSSFSFLLGGGYKCIKMSVVLLIYMYLNLFIYLFINEFWNA